MWIRFTSVKDKNSLFESGSSKRDLPIQNSKDNKIDRNSIAIGSQKDINFRTQTVEWLWYFPDRNRYQSKRYEKISPVCQGGKRTNHFCKLRASFRRGCW
jgi:hypothetical protein